VTTSFPLCGSEAADLLFREQSIREAQDRIWQLADAVQNLHSRSGWEGPAADAFRILVGGLHLPLRAQAIPLEIAGQTIGVWRCTL
jgi:hypothetical protein